MNKFAIVKKLWGVQVPFQPPCRPVYCLVRCKRVFESPDLPFVTHNKDLFNFIKGTNSYC